MQPSPPPTGPTASGFTADGTIASPATSGTDDWPGGGHQSGDRAEAGVGRRAVIAGGVALALAGGTRSSAAEPAPAEAETARGTVFDADSHPPRGIPGVLVSNGGEVTQTDAQGAWSLPVRPGDSLFVIKPAGWAVPLDPGTNLPRFARIHAPDGSPDLGLRFAGVAPTGKLPAQIDFPLHRQTEPTRFDAILFADPQPETLAELGYIRDDVVAVVDQGQAAFGITHGDVMFDDLSFYGRYNRIVGTVGLPWYNCPGNHDMNFEVPDNTHSRETFKRVFGTRWHAFQYGGATFFILDNVDYLGTDPARPNGAGKYRGYFGERQLRFVRNVLATVPRDRLVVFSFHIPLRTLAGSEPAIAAVDARDFLAAISTHPNSVSFAGHTHTNEHWYLDAADGYAGGVHHHHVLGAVSGSWWSGPFDARGIPLALANDGSPNGYHILSVDQAAYTTTLVPAHDPARGQMRVMLDSQLHGGDREVMRDYHAGALLTGPLAADQVGSTRVVVNLFDGGPRSTVAMAIGDEALRPLRRVERQDPFVVEVYSRNAETKKPWVEPAKSAHIWQAALPAGLPPGTHRVTVKATDEYGRSREAKLILEIV